MAALQIRDVPDPVREALAGAARQRGESLQSYLLALLKREAASLRNQQLLQEWATEPLIATGTDVDIPRLVREEREQRERDLQQLVDAARG